MIPYPNELIVLSLEEQIYLKIAELTNNNILRLFKV